MYVQYACKEVELIPTAEIKCNCLNENKLSVWVDECLEEEIKSLWDNGIKTIGCCCGHGCFLGFIQVTEDCIDKMKSLGYQNYLYTDSLNDSTRLDAFIPKTTYHKTIDKIEYQYRL